MNRKVCVAPMMDCTDRHERFFLRLISKNVLLYTEMIVSEAINRGDKKKLLSFNLNEKPLALQIGGSSPALLAEAAKTGEDFGYDEINLNLGCPSKKVEKNKFGACLMKEPNLVADCLNKMQSDTRHARPPLTPDDIDRILSIAEEMDSEFMRDDEPHDMIGGYTIESKKLH